LADLAVFTVLSSFDPPLSWRGAIKKGGGMLILIVCVVIIFIFSRGEYYPDQFINPGIHEGGVGVGKHK
jgi:hypothetical protein